MVTGEVVFTTGMSGYQESMTDPSFARQLITFTYPHVGNYGVSQEAMESERPWARAAIMRAAVNREDAPGAERGWLDWLSDCGVPAITGVDTRALVRHIRTAGAMRGGVFPAAMSEAQARERIAAEPAMAGLDLAREVTPAAMTEHGDGDGPRIAVIDTGIKGSIVRNLVARGARVELHPCTATAAELTASDPDAIFLANGPGDPAALGYIVATVRELVGTRPVWGICLGHQLLCQAVGLETYKLRLRPPRRQPPGQGPAHRQDRDHLAEPRLRRARRRTAGRARGGRRAGALGDRLRRGRADPRQPLRPHGRGPRAARGRERTVQYHPEAGPGPNDALYQFDRFLEAVRAA